MAIKTGVTIKDNMGKLLAGLDMVTSKRVMIGVPAEEADRRGGDDDGPINNAALLYIHDNGAPEANIPARPGLKEGVKDAQQQMQAELVGAAKRALSADPAGTDTGFHRAGIIGQNAVRHRITEGPWAPLSPRTIRARKAKAKKSGLELQDSDIRPLIYTGQMRAAVTYVVRQRGEK